MEGPPSDVDLLRRACAPAAEIQTIKALVSTAQGRQLEVPESEMYRLVDALKSSYVAALKTLQTTLLKQGPSAADETETARDEDGDPLEPSTDGERAGLVLDSIRVIATRHAIACTLLFLISEPTLKRLS